MARSNSAVDSASKEATELEFRNLFVLEVLQSELLRTTILAWAFGGAAIYLTLSMLVVHVVDLPIVESGFPFAPIIIFQLQLSMLPQQVPTLPHLEIAAYMKPATEVGGDYYDFLLSEDGTLTAVIGVSTGHELKSGTMVTAAKSLFAALAKECH